MLPFNTGDLMCKFDCIYKLLSFQRSVAVTSNSSQTVQRILLPAGPNQIQLRAVPSTLAQIRPSGSSTSNQFPPGTTILSSGSTSSGTPGFALVPTIFSQVR